MKNITNICVILATLALATTTFVARGELEEKDFTTEFVAQCKAKAEQGDAVAQYHYGRAFFKGWGVKQDLVKAAEWWRKAAEQGDAYAQFSLGLVYHDGSGVEKDLANAVEWYRKAAEQGVAEAQYNLAVCYYSGNGVEKDLANAVEWWTKAAEQGDADAQRNLGLCYYTGDGVKKDFTKVAEWLGKAATQGDEGAIKILDSLLEQYKNKSGEKGSIYRFDGFEIEGSALNAALQKIRTAHLGGWEKLKNRRAKLRVTAMDDARWTTNDTERVWASAAELSTRTATTPRSSFADAQGGEGILETFATRYMPNAYDYYQKCREKAIERKEILKENFPKGAGSDSTGGTTYAKVVKACAKAVSEMDRRHDELCHFYLLHTAGVMTEAELAEIDSRKICILLPRITSQIEEATIKTSSLDDKERTFAGKYMPDTLVGYDLLTNELKDGKDAYINLRSKLLSMDAVRSNQELTPLRERLADIHTMLDKIVDSFKQQRTLHAVDEVSSDDLAELDQKLSAEIQTFEKQLPIRDYFMAWVGKNWNGVCREEIYVSAPLMGLHKVMVPLRGKNKGFFICKFEVTQALWEAVMGNNPSEFNGATLPVENVSPKDCALFIKKLNALPEVRASGMEYRLPTTGEWKDACLSGAKEKKDDLDHWTFYKLKDGTEITQATVGEVAWHSGNSSKRTHPVGQMKPNAFGLYDMIGNVAEISLDNYGGYENGGWSWRDALGEPGNLNFIWHWIESRNDSGKNKETGFRLAAD